jgi:hypothetical protein
MKNGLIHAFKLSKIRKNKKPTFEKLVKRQMAIFSLKFPAVLERNRWSNSELADD